MEGADEIEDGGGADRDGGDDTAIEEDAGRADGDDDDGDDTNTEGVTGPVCVSAEVMTCVYAC